MTTKDTTTPLVVDVEWLAAHKDDPGVVVVDTTTFLTLPEGDGYYDVESGREAYRRGHIPGAVFADLLHDLADEDAPHQFTALDSDTFAQRIGALGIGNGDHVVVYDQGQLMWATRLWWNLRFEGFDSISVLEGGFPAWRDAGLPVATGDESREPTTFTARRRPELRADVDRVLAATEDERSLLVYVLDPESFRGEKVTYARPGHIPASTNVPVMSLYRGPGQVATTEQVEQAFHGTGALDRDKQVITYCGGGIAATYSAFNLARLGRDDVAVYDGSMTEWAANPELPLETGG
ncbi:sulfurtransferase [Geodermatophilus sp. SYSU D00079]